MTKKTIILIILSLIFLGLCSLFGAMNFGVKEIFANSDARDVWLNMRLPRIVLGFLAGGGLSLAGMSFQAVFRNPLAEPYTLGISSGATLGCVACTVLGVEILGFATVSVFAFLGAVLSVTIVYFLAGRGRKFGVAEMLLAGIGVNFFFSAFVLLLEYFGKEYNLAKIMHWTMGGLEIVGFSKILEILPFCLIGIYFIFRNTKELNLLSLGEETAITRGVDTKKVKKHIFFGASLMIGSLCAVCGPIAFVGMICPHIMRMIFGWDTGRLGPACFVFGGVFLVLCDTVGRCIISPAELPVGIITSLLGGPFFIYLLCKKKV